MLESSTSDDILLQLSCQYKSNRHIYIEWQSTSVIIRTWQMDKFRLHQTNNIKLFTKSTIINIECTMSSFVLPSRGWGGGRCNMEAFGETLEYWTLKSYCPTILSMLRRGFGSYLGFTASVHWMTFPCSKLVCVSTWVTYELNESTTRLGASVTHTRGTTFATFHKACPKKCH